MRSLDSTFERAAATSAPGGSPCCGIVFPLVRPGVLVALFFTLLFSFDEAVVAICLSGIRVKTLPRRMFEALLLESDPTVGVVATLYAGAVSVCCSIGAIRPGPRHLGRAEAGGRVGAAATSGAR